MMIDTERKAVGGHTGEVVDPSSKNKDSEKKKRSRVKQLLSDVKKQVEFWFGDVNLHKDRFLKQLIDESQDGYVDISVLTSFNRMKKLTTDVKLVARALKNSSVVEVNLEGDKVRRQHPIGDIPKDVDRRTVYVELLPKDVTHGWMERVFTKCGNVVYVSLPRYKTTGDPKGFAFVEFEKEEEAQKAIKMLNNPPEDAPRKPGIFPKTKNRKPIPPLPADNPTSCDEEEKKKRKKKKKKETATAQTSAGEPKEPEMEVEPSERKRKRSAAESLETEPSGARKPPAKQTTDKKRRRSQIGEVPETEAHGEMPSKMRKTSEGDKPSSEKKEASVSDVKDPPVDCDKGKEEGEEKREDSLLKAKRKRKKKHKEKLKIGEEVVPLRVMPKYEWLKLKKEYLTLQKRSMGSLKKFITDMDPVEDKGQMDTNNGLKHENCSEKSQQPREKENSQGPQFTSGVIIKIMHSKPLPGRKFIKDALSNVSPVLYVDILAGDAEGHIRFKTPEDAKAVTDKGAELQKEHGWKLEILSGDHEQRYWQKILVDRQVKLNRPREKKRGTEKLIAKAEKIIMARAKEANKHIRFQEN